MTPKTLINGISYSFCDISFNISNIGAPVLGFYGIPIKSISYNATQQKTANFENSHYATSYSYSAKKYTGSLGLTLDACEALRDSIFDLLAPTRSMVDMPALDITLKFSVKGKVNTTTLKNVVFLSENFSGSEGNDTLAVTADFISSYIDFGSKTSAQQAINLVTLAADFAGLDNQLI